MHVNRLPQLNGIFWDSLAEKLEKKFGQHPAQKVAVYDRMVDSWKRVKHLPTRRERHAALLKDAPTWGVNLGWKGALGGGSLSGWAADVDYFMTQIEKGDFSTTSDTKSYGEIATVTADAAGKAATATARAARDAAATIVDEATKITGKGLKNLGIDIPKLAFMAGGFTLAYFLIVKGAGGAMKRIGK